MTQISRDDVLSLARLSSIKLADEEVEGLQQDIAKILDYVQQLEELDTDGVEPTYQLNGQMNKWREDTIEEPIAADTLLGLSPESSDGQIKVPKVFA